MAETPLLYLLLLPLALTFSSPSVETRDEPEPSPFKVPAYMGAATDGFPEISISGALTGMELIRTACKGTMNSELCESKLKADPSSQKADLKGLAAIMLKTANSTATAVLDHITTLQKGDDGNTFIEKCLLACTEHYLDAVDQLEDSTGAMKDEGYNDVIAWVTAAMDDATTCQEEFKIKPGHESLLTGQNQEFNNVCSIVLALTKHLSTAGSAAEPH